jgi:hypothetical protein
VIDLSGGIDPTPPRRPWRGGGWLVGDKKTLILLLYNVTLVVVIEVLHLLENIFL